MLTAQLNTINLNNRAICQVEVVAMGYRMEEAKAALETQQLLGVPRSSIENAAISIEMVAGGDDGTLYPSVLLNPFGERDCPTE